MKVAVYVVCAALTIAYQTSSASASAAANDRDQEGGPMEVSAGAGIASPGPQGLLYGRAALARLAAAAAAAARYRAAGAEAAPMWADAPTPRFYLLPEYGDALDAQEFNEQEDRFKRAGNGPSLSIVNPMDVLRQRLLLEIARRQMKESDRQVAENRMMMNSIGKRGSYLRQPPSHHGNAISYDNM